MKKRMLAMLLVLILLIGMLPTGVFATEATNKGYLKDLRLVHADTGDAYLTGFNPETYEYSFVVPSDVSNSKMSIGALLSDAAPEGSTITMKYKNYYNLTGNTKSVVLTSSATENTEGSKFSSFVSTSTGNSCTIEVGVEGDIQTYTINVYRYEGIKLNKTEMTIPVGSTPSLTASKGFGLGDADAVTWSSSDEAVATVADGVITAKGVGTATITATAKTYTAACTVTVKAVDELLVGRNTFGYLEDLVISQADRYTDVAIDFDFDPTQLWQKFEVNSNGSLIFLAVTANEKYADNYGSIVVNFEYSVDGGATWVNDSGSQYDKNILNDGTLSRMFQNVTVGDGMDMSFHAGETLLMRMIVGTYTPVTGVTGATAENSDVYYFTVTQRAALGGIAVANGEGTAFALDQEFEASDTEYIIKNFSGDTVSITPTIGKAAKDCKIYVEGKEVASGAAAALTVSVLPENEYGYHYATIDVKYEGPGVASNDTYTVTLAPGDYTPAITTQPAAATNCTQGDDVSLNIVAAAPENKGELTYSWKYSTRSNMYSAVDLGTSTVNSVKVPTEASGTVYLQCTVTNTYNGVTYTVTSEVVSVTIEAKSAAAPVININRSDLTGGGTYYMNETAEFPLYTIASAADNGTLTYEWFRSDRADYTNTDGSEPESVGAGKIQWVGTSAIGNVQCLYPVMDKVGTWYYFCKVTNTITLPDGTTTSTSANTAISNAYTVVELGIKLTGSGTESDPYQITSAADMDHIAERVNTGISFNGMYLKVMNDITLSDTWAGIGALKEGAATAKGSTVNGFAGTLFGANEDITITIPSGCPGLLNYSNASTVKDLSIYGTNIVGSAVVNNSYVNYGTDDDYNMGVNPINITIENVTLKSGSHTTGAGLARGGGSGANTTNVINCVVESGVTIGSESANSVGSFVAVLNGSVINCTSAATVYGVNHVGGLAGHKGETMGACTISNSSFTGKVVATGNWVGGLMGRGYSDAADGGLNDYTTAPNTPVVTIANSYVSGSVSGADYVGGLFGGEPVVQECWANGVGSVRNNVFYGTITATGENVGAIVGYMNSMNENQSGMNNYYLDTCGASKGFGKINIAPADFDPTPLATAKTAVEMANGTVTALLNESETSYKNWVQGVHHPVLSADPVAYYLQVSGNYKTKYTVGEELDLTGIELRAVWSDGSVTYPTLDDVKVEGYDKTTRGQQTVTLTYGAVSVQMPITVLLPEGQIEVSFTLLGDSKHDSDTDGNVHTLAKENLTTWIAEKKYTVSNNATVLDLVDMVLVANNMTYTNSNGNYIDSITYNGEKLAEFDNGGNSGWMFTLNGVHGLLGVSEQYLNDGDVVVFHYTDDYTQEVDNPETIDVNVTISNVGDVVMAQQSVSVSDLNGDGKFDVDEVLYAAHEAGYTGGAAEGYSSYIGDYGLSLGKLWGDTSGCYGYWLNNASCWSLADEVEDGDYLVAFVYSDKIGWSDNYAWFDQFNFAADSELTVTLKKSGYDASYNTVISVVTGASITAYDADGNAIDSSKYAVKDNGDGTYTITFIEDGEYTLIATETTTPIVPAVCKASVVAGRTNTDVENIYKTTGDYLDALEEQYGISVGSIGGEWMVIGLIRSGREVDDAYYDAVVKYVRENIDENERLHKSKSTDNSRMILALTAMGCDVTDVDGHNLLEGLDEMSYLKKQGINGPIWALIALDSHDYEPMGDVTREKLIQTILDAQLADGGWVVGSTLTSSDVDMTAMAIQALAPYYNTNADVKAAVDKALVFLSDAQLADGSYGSVDGSSSESCAQVIVALTALGIDPENDARFTKNGISAVDALCAFYVDNGGFKHIPNGALDGMATEQGYYALASYYRFLNGKTSLYDMSDVTIKTSNPDAPENPTNPSNPSDPTNPSNPTVPSKPGDSSNPQTGDDTNIALYTSLMLVSVAGLAALLVADRKRKYAGKYSK